MCGVLSLLAINALYLALFGSYDFSLGSLHVVAREIFKPLRWFNVAFVFLLFLAPTLLQKSDSDKNFALSDAWTAVVLLILIFAAYHQTLAVNLDVFEWDHRDISAKLKTPGDFLSLFSSAQPNGFYRPITYVSFWLDYVLFKGHLWAYHLQNLLIHFLNSLAVLKLGKEFGLSRQTYCSAALLFSVAAINFEAVMWPAARFDLLAALFTLLATLYLLRYLKRQSVSSLVLSIVCFVLAVLNKESAYCFPLISAILFFFPFNAAFKQSSLRSRLYSFLLVMLSLGLLLALRFIVGFGGYRDPAGSSLHLSFSSASIFSFVMNALGLTQFAVNASVTLPLYAKLGVVVFVLAAVAIAIKTRPSKKPLIYLVALLFVSALPVFTLLGWIRPSLQNARFLYLPAVWMSLVLAVSLASVSRHGLPLLAAIVLSSGLAAHHNVAVYKEMLTRADVLAEFIWHDQQRDAASTVYLTGLPEAPDGVFYFPSQLATKVKARMPDVNVVLVPIEEPAPSPADGSRIYKWDGLTRTLVLQVNR